MKKKETYYETLSGSSNGWQDRQNNHYPFVKYNLEIVLGAYKEFDSRVAYLQNRKLSKPDRVKALFENSLQTLSKKMILEKCPDISVSTVETTLSALLKVGYIVKTKAGKNTAYIRNTSIE